MWGLVRKKKKYLVIDHWISNDQNDCWQNHADGHEKQFWWFPIFVIKNCAGLGVKLDPVKTPNPEEGWRDKLKVL